LLSKIFRATSAAVVAALAVSLSLAQQPLSATDKLNRDRAHVMLRDAYENLKKHYYDTKYHGLDLDARYKEHDAAIARSTSLGEGFSVVAEFLDGLNDSHTFFEPPARSYRLDYGFRVQMYGDKPLIARVRPGTDAESKVKPGDEVLSWNGLKVNRDQMWKINYLFNSLAPQKTSMLSLRDPSGQFRDVVVQPTTHQLKRVLDLSGDRGDSDRWELIRENENLDHYVRQRGVEFEGAMIWKMPEFDMTDDQVDRMFATVRKYPALILDLRDNHGGLVATLERMVANVFDRDVKIADRIGRKELKPQLAKTRGGNNVFSGKLIVLVDSNSASAAELFARVVQLEKRGVVLGDVSSGHVMESRGYSQSQGADTKIFYSFSVTDADLVMADGKSLEHSGVTPDELIVPTALDIAEGKDPVLARAAELAGVKTTPAAAGKLFPFEWMKL
jgi:C-terminal processing protease CtpA/Prc